MARSACGERTAPPSRVRGRRPTPDPQAWRALFREGRWALGITAALEAGWLVGLAGILKRSRR